jgi:endonuclease/exonuclease/phosphatase family metal-dependent hydrolase
VCGDFNQPAREGWTPPTSAVAPSPPAATYPADAPVEAIDYCIVEGMTAAAEAMASTASDHLPVVVTCSP